MEHQTNGCNLLINQMTEDGKDYQLSLAKEEYPNEFFFSKSKLFQHNRDSQHGEHMTINHNLIRPPSIQFSILHPFLQLFTPKHTARSHVCYNEEGKDLRKQLYVRQYSQSLRLFQSNYAPASVNVITLSINIILNSVSCCSFCSGSVSYKISRYSINRFVNFFLLIRHLMV